jgi:hypothetical protein
MTDDDWGPHARTTDPWTSQWAADHLDIKTDVARVVLFHAMFERPVGWTAFEAGADQSQTGPLGIKPGMWKRQSDAKNAGYIEPVLDEVTQTVVWRRSGSNRPQQAYRITEAGKAWLRSLRKE